MLSIGATAPILGYGALNALLFMTYNRTLTLLSDSPAAPNSFAKVFLAGATGGFASFVVSAPTELIKCRAQVSTERHATSWSIAKQIWMKDGIRGCTMGVGSRVCGMQWDTVSSKLYVQAHWHSLTATVSGLMNGVSRHGLLQMIQIEKQP